MEAGFGKRIMFGSDTSMWPQTMAIGIEAIESADFLEGRSSCRADRDWLIPGRR